MNTQKTEISGAAPDAVQQIIDEEGDIEHDEKAFYNYYARMTTGNMPGFAPAGIKGSDSDREVLKKWQAYMRSPKFKRPEALPPKRVLMAMLRNNGGDRELEAQGYTPDLIAAFNHGHLTNEMLLAKPGPRTPEEGATWEKPTLMDVLVRKGVRKVRMGRADFEREEIQKEIGIYVFDTGIDSEDSVDGLFAAILERCLYIYFRNPWLKSWWLGCEVFALEVPFKDEEGYFILTAVEAIEPSRRLYYIRDQISDQIKAFWDARKAEVEKK